MTCLVAKGLSSPEVARLEDDPGVNTKRLKTLGQLTTIIPAPVTSLFRSQVRSCLSVAAS